MIEIIFTIAFLYCWTSLAEWWIHKNVMHKPFIDPGAFLDHAVAHHADYFPTCDARPVENDASRVNLRFGLRTLAGLVITLAAPVGALCFFWLPIWHVAIAALWAFAVWLIWSTIHDEMHFPKGRLFARLQPFKYWHAYHCRHHEKTSKNFNIVCVGADWILGTYAKP